MSGIFAGIASGITAGTATETAAEGESAEGKKILMVVAQENFRDEELFEPMSVFESAGADVIVAAPRKEEAKGMRNMTVQPDIAISDARAEDFDAIVIVGGSGSPVFLWENAELQKLVRDAYESGKVVAAICLSPVVLARAGVLKGKEATVFPDRTAVNELKAGGAIYKDEGVVIADRIVTARDPAHAREFANAILNTLSGQISPQPSPQASQPSQTPQIPETPPAESPETSDFALSAAILICVICALRRFCR